MTPPRADLPTIFLLVPVVGLAVGVTVAAVARRGRRVGTTPTCRRCWRDLGDKPVDSNVCPECSASLDEANAIQLGKRVTRRRWLAAAVVLEAACVAWLAILGLGVCIGADWDRYKPQWWLVSEARGEDANARDAALAELVRRIGEGEISDPRLSALADEALAYQADANKPWAQGWGDLLEAADAAGRLPDEKWRSYVRQAVVPSIVLCIRSCGAAALRCWKSAPGPLGLAAGGSMPTG